MAAFINLRRSKLSAVCIASVVLAALAAVFVLPREPDHNGRGITEWLEMAEDSKVNEAERQSAEESIRLIGSRAVPVLLKKLRSDDGSREPMAIIWNKFVNRAVPSRWYSSLYMDPTRAFENHQQAIRGFRVIGTNGNSGVPELSMLLHDDKFRQDAVLCLRYIRTPAVFEVFTGNLTNSNPKVRFESLQGLAGFDEAELHRVAGSITALARDPDEQIAALAIQLLPDLIPEQELVPLLLDALQDSRVLVQRKAIGGLFLGPQEAMPAIARCFSSLDPTNRMLATNALITISPYRAVEFGVITNELPPHAFERYNYWKNKAGTNSLRSAIRGNSER